MAAQPYATVEKAVAASRALPARAGKTVTIELAPTAPYELTQPLVLSPADSGLTIASAPGGKKASVSGGRRLTPQWNSLTLPGRNTSLRVYVAEGVAGNFTTMSVKGKRQILARWPDADPEKARFPTR